MNEQPLINTKKENNDNLINNQSQNQVDMMPPSMNTQKNNYIASHQSYNFSNHKDLNDPMIQPLYHPSQDNILPPQQGLPVDSYPPQNQNSIKIPNIIQTKALQYQAQYENYKNISEIPHKGIYQVDENTFYISKGCFFKIFPFILFFLGVGLASFSFFITNNNQNSFLGPSFFMLIFGITFALVGFILFFKMYNCIYFIKGPNSLTVMKKSIFGKKTRNYNPNELIRIDFLYNYSNDSRPAIGVNEDFVHHYNLIILPRNGKKDTIFSIQSNSRIFTPEEIEYFLYYINTHIQILNSRIINNKK